MNEPLECSNQIPATDLAQMCRAFSLSPAEVGLWMGQSAAGVYECRECRRVFSSATEQACCSYPCHLKYEQSQREQRWRQMQRVYAARFRERQRAANPPGPRGRPRATRPAAERHREASRKYHYSAKGKAWRESRKQQAAERVVELERRREREQAVAAVEVPEVPQVARWVQRIRSNPF